MGLLLRSSWNSFTPAIEMVLMVEGHEKFYFFLWMLEGGGITVICPNLGFERWFARGTLLSITAVIIALCRPYKKSCVNVIDTLLLSHLALICYIFSVCAFHTNIDPYSICSVYSLQFFVGFTSCFKQSLLLIDFRNYPKADSYS